MIICINDKFSQIQKSIIKNLPVQDKVYTVRDVIQSRKGVGFLLEEIVNLKSGWVGEGENKMTFEPNFNQSRFSDLQGNPLTEEKIREFKTQLKLIKL